jgi:hypothetical protein
MSFTICRENMNHIFISIQLNPGSFSIMILLMLLRISARTSHFPAEVSRLESNIFVDNLTCHLGLSLVPVQQQEHQWTNILMLHRSLAEFSIAQDIYWQMGISSVNQVLPPINLPYPTNSPFYCIA